MAIRQRESKAKVQSRTEGLFRKYPPLAVLVVVLLIAALVLPSALNLPQANPTTVLEYAPVPPEDDSPPSDEGNVSSLGLGTSSGLTTGAPPSVPLVDPGKQGGSGKRPVTKRCVGKPLRQTEDPNSPPCVPFFEGDNGGATYQGVTGTEVRILIFASTYTIRTNGETPPPNGSYCDVDKPANSERGCRDPNTSVDIDFVRAARTLSTYFNDRFQTYDRRIHFWLYYSSANSPAARRAAAVDNWTVIKPFAVIDMAGFGQGGDAYQETMTKRKVSVYGSFVGLGNAHYRKYAPLVWGFWPDIEHSADMFITYICNRVAPFPVSHSGMPGDMGKPRKYALLSTTDPAFPGMAYYAELVKLGIQNCPNGAKLDVVAEGTYSNNRYSQHTGQQPPQEARNNVAKFRGAGATTILWLQGFETATTAEANNTRWYPEWIFAGDQQNDAINLARDQQQDVWRHAWGISNYLNEAQRSEAPCILAFREVDPTYDGGETGAAEFDACSLYRNMFTVAKAIQIAGPRLNPNTVDQGHHAIPKTQSTDPRIASCYYDPGDYTCVKDANEIWWDADAEDPDGDVDVKGCYRMVDNGKRYIAGTWPTGDGVFKNYSDPCNTVEGQGYILLST
jgi:hypothetical protein